MLYTQLCVAKRFGNRWLSSLTNRIVTPLVSGRRVFEGACGKNGSWLKHQGVQAKSNLLPRVCSATHCSWFHGETFSETSATL